MLRPSKKKLNKGFFTNVKTRIMKIAIFYIIYNIVFIFYIIYYIVYIFYIIYYIVFIFYIIYLYQSQYFHVLPKVLHF
jgi:hypothetical protein